MVQRDIPPHRKTAYYIGGAIALIGVVLFLSTFVSGCVHFGDFSNFQQRARTEIGTALTGMILIVVGGIIQNIGAKGAAGSGIVLDPQQARRDVEPWSRMTGGMLSDVLEEVVPNLNVTNATPPLPFDEQIRRLDGLKRDGLLSESEYADAKRRILEALGNQPDPR